MKRLFCNFPGKEMKLKVCILLMLMFSTPLFSLTTADGGKDREMYKTEYGQICSSSSTWRNIEKGWVTFSNRDETNEHDDTEVDAIPDTLSIIALCIILTVILKNAFLSRYIRKIKKEIVIEVPSHCFTVRMLQMPANMPS